MNAFQEGEFEVTERNEEAVISKEANDETQHIRETKKRKNVKVERISDKDRHWFINIFQSESSFERRINYLC